MSDHPIVLHRRHQFSLAEVADNAGHKLEYALHKMMGELAAAAEDHPDRTVTSIRIWVEIEEVLE